MNNIEIAIRETAARLLSEGRVAVVLGYTRAPARRSLFAEGRLEVEAATDAEAVAAVHEVTAAEGILPALETAHAFAVLPRFLAGTGGSGSQLPVGANPVSRTTSRCSKGRRAAWLFPSTASRTGPSYASGGSGGARRDAAASP